MAMGISAAEMPAPAWRQTLQTALETQTWLLTALEPGGEHPLRRAGWDPPSSTSSLRVAAGGNVPTQRVFGGGAARTWMGRFAPGGVHQPCRVPVVTALFAQVGPTQQKCLAVGIWAGKRREPAPGCAHPRVKGVEKHPKNNPRAEIPAHPAGQKGGGMLSCWLSSGTPGVGGKRTEPGPGAAPGESPQGCAIIRDPSKARSEEIRQLLA